jgi:microcystin-dependent protein
MYNAKTGTANLPATPPPGSVMAFLGTIEPDGWIFANGSTRTNGSDGRYDSLLALNIGTGNKPSYTPPDLKGAFLRGAGIPNNNTYSTYQGATTVGGIQTDQNKPHSHNIDRSKFQHGHFYSHKTPSLSTHNLVYDIAGSSRRLFNIITGTPSGSATTESYSYTQVATADAFSAREFVTTEFSDSGETRPYNYSVNWIIKL